MRMTSGDSPVPGNAGSQDEPSILQALSAQLTAIEQRLTRLESVQSTATADPAGTDPAAVHPAPADPATSGPAPAPPATTASATASPAADNAPDDPYWVLTGMDARYPDDDVVLYAGTFTADGGGYRWQYGLSSATILDGDFADAAPALSALAHPVRLSLLQAVLAGTHQTAELTALPGIGTSGQVYHHLNQLAAAGWLRSPRRGRWEVPGERTIPLLALIMAASS